MKSDETGTREPYGGVSGGSPRAEREHDRAESAARTESAAGAGVLAGTPRQVLARLVGGDPLDLRCRTAARVRERALLLDGDRALLRVMAHVARSAPRRSGSLAAWVGRRIDRALDELLEESLAPEPEEPRAPAPVFRDFGRQLDVRPEALRRACAAFHRLPRADRAAFFELVIEGRSLDRAVRERPAGERPVSATELARRARRGLLALMGETLAPEPLRPAPASDAEASEPERGAR